MRRRVSSAERKGGASRTGAVVAGVLIAVLQSGCFVYQQTDPGEVKLNQPIRVVVKNEEGLRLAREFGYGAPVLEGALAALSPDSLQLAVWVGKEFRATDFALARQTIPVVRADIVNVQLGVLSADSTTLTVVSPVSKSLSPVNAPWPSTVPIWYVAPPAVQVMFVRTQSVSPSSVT